MAHRYQENIYLLDDQFIFQGYNSGVVRWKRCMRQGMGKGYGVPMPSLDVPPLRHLHMFTNLEVLQPVLWDFAEALLHSQG